MFLMLLMNMIYYDRELVDRYGRASREFAMKYDWGRVIDEWDKLINKLCLKIP